MEIIMQLNTFGPAALERGFSGMTPRMKEIEIVEVVKVFLKSALMFADVVKGYHQGNLEFSTVEKLVDVTKSSPLFDLKERCHALFRYQNAEVCDEKEKFFDLTIGSIQGKSVPAGSVRTEIPGAGKKARESPSGEGIPSFQEDQITS
jgi:hypothetical protein